MQLISPAPFFILLSLWPTLTCVPEPKPREEERIHQELPHTRPVLLPRKSVPEELALREALVRRENLWSAKKWSGLSS
jgi:hypothetical protein